MSEPLLTPDSTFPPSKYEYPINSYNEVVYMHNLLSPKKPQLSYLRENTLYMQIYLAMTTPLGMLVTVVLLAGVPLVNLWIFSCTVFCFFYVDWQLITHRRNLARVPDPFAGFFPEDNLCNTLEKKYTTLKLSIKCTEDIDSELQGFTFNRQLNQELLSRAVDSRVEMTIYSGSMYSAYHDLPREKTRLGVWALVSAVICCISTYLWLVLLVLA